jgi:hypothetical protein
MKTRIAICAAAMFLITTSCNPVRQSYTHPEGPRYMGQFAEASDHLPVWTDRKFILSENPH